MKRFRKDLGDLTSLADSIKEIGLIHPIVVNSGGVLIAGERRLAACKIAGVEPEYRTVNFENPVKAELHENTMRKDFTYSEVFAIGEYLNEMESKQFTDHHNVVGTNDTNNKQPRDKVAEITGLGTATISKVNQVFKSDFPEVKEQLDSGEISVDTAYKEVKNKEKKANHKADIEQQKISLEQNKPEITGTFDVIVLDPPWNYGREYDPASSRVANPYPEMTQSELLKLNIPLNDNGIVWLWTTHAFIQDAFELLKEWGFDYKAILTWNKQTIGMGHWLRMQTEFCLFAIKGQPVWDNTTYRDIITEKKRQHSRKPDAFYDMINDICYGSKLDYFSREQRKGWESFGNDINKF